MDDDRQNGLERRRSSGAEHEIVTEWAPEIAAFAAGAEALALGLFDTSGAVRYANDALRALFDADGEAVLSLERLAEPRLSALTATTDGLAYRGRLIIAGAEGAPREVPGEIWRRQDRLLVLALPDGEVARLRRELEQAREALDASQRDLRVLEKEMSRFIGIAAHDLRSPLANILTAGQYLRETLTDVGEDNEILLSFIPQQAHYMLSLISDLLDMSQLESGTFVLEREIIEIEPFVETIVRPHRSMAETKGIRILLNVTASGWVDVDPKRLRQVLDNLISNAIKFSPHASTITITVEREDSKVRFSVQDEGPGISEQEQARLFQYFSRTSARPTGNETSTGLGLAIARRVVEAHGGEIGVVSAPGQGATFWFTLPCEE